MTISRTLGTAAFVVVPATFAFCFGYYRGYQEKARLSTSFHLAMNETIYQTIQGDHLDAAKKQLKMVIAGESDHLRELERNPLRAFQKDYTTARAGNMSTYLERADKIAQEK